MSCQDLFFTRHKKTQHLAGFCSTAPYICIHAVLDVDRRFVTIPIARCNTGWLALCSSCVYLPQGGLRTSWYAYVFLTGLLLVSVQLASEHIAYCVGRGVFPHAISTSRAKV